jgi:predicted DNA binding CopG/RHH family protein
MISQKTSKEEKKKKAQEKARKKYEEKRKIVGVSFTSQTELEAIEKTASVYNMTKSQFLKEVALAYIDKTKQYPHQMSGIPQDQRVNLQEALVELRNLNTHLSDISGYCNMHEKGLFGRNKKIKVDDIGKRVEKIEKILRYFLDMGMVNEL